MLNLKQFVLGSTAGRMLMSARDAIDLFHAAYNSPESVGTAANDQLATLLVTRICQSGRTFIDVGAHIGSIISSVAHNDPSINIVAIEAVSEKATNLRKKFPFIKVHACAVGDQDGEVSFYINTRQSGYSSLGKPAVEGDSFIREVRVPIKRLDELVAPNDIDVIKIDVEGAELGVLRGSRKIIETSCPIIMFESAPPGDPDGSGFTKEDLWQFLTELNYTIHIPNRVAHNDQGLGREGFVESHVYPRRTTNYFAIPRERRIEVRDRARNLLGIVKT